MSAAYLPTRTEKKTSELDPLTLHQHLALHHRAQLRLTNSAPLEFEAQLAEDVAARRRENAFIQHELQSIRDRARTAPSSARELVLWFEALRETGPGQGDPLFPWLAEHATLDQMRWFLLQEISGEAGFEDLVALTQVGLPVRTKLELARNYWDEMGRGQERGMHGPLLAVLAQHFGITPASNEAVCWESLALANLMFALARNPQHKWRSVGALGVIELTAPGRAKLVNDGLRRLGVPGEARRYFALHATLDVKHSLAWNAEAIGPLVEEFPEAAPCIAEGALMRLSAGARCFARYRRELQLAARRVA